MIDGIFFVNLHMEKGQIAPKNTCIIIGNGFDINLGLPTSYTDFVKSTHFDDMVKRGNELAKYLKSKFELQNWIDIENELKTYSLERSDASFKSNYELLICALINIIAKTKSTFLQNEKYIFQDFKPFPTRLFDNRLIAA